MSKYRFAWLMLVVFLFLGTVPAEDVQNEIPLTEKQVLKESKKHLQKGEFVLAETGLRRFLKDNPNNTKVKLELSFVLLKQRRLYESYEVSLQIAKEEPNNARAFALVGYSLLSAGNFDEAIQILKRANELDNDEPLAWAGAGLHDFYENRIERGLEKLREAVFKDPDEPDFLFAKAQVAARAEKYKEAADSYRRFLDIAPTKDVERRNRIKGLIDFLNYLGNVNGLYRTRGESETKVSVEIVRQRPVIKVKISGKPREYNFVLDTGSGITVISEDTAKELKMKPIARGGNARAIGGDGKFEIVYGFLRSLEVGEVKIENVPVYIRKFHGEGGHKVDGYIGLAVISRFLTTIDYGEKSFSLIRRNDNEAREFAQNEYIFPLRLTSSGFLSGEVKLEGIEAPLNFIVDTGASVSVISNDLAFSNELKSFITDERLRVSGAAGILEDVPSLKLPKITFGQHTRESITAIALDLETINESSGFEQAGILGGNFLQDYRLTFDFKASKIAITPVTMKK